jgi:hypothetical protein
LLAILLRHLRVRLFSHFLLWEHTAQLVDARNIVQKGALSWKVKWFSNHFLIAVAIVSLAFGTLFVAYNLNSITGQLVVCPGCNLPETLQIDHYTVQNSTSGPSLLTMWLSGQGPAGKVLIIQAIYVENIPTKYPGCQYIPYNESSCLTPFPVPNVRVPAGSIVPVSIDTSSQGFYFTTGQPFAIDIVADKVREGISQIAYPPPSLVETGYSIGYDRGQTYATLLNLTIANMATTSETLVSVSLKDLVTNYNQTFQMNGPTISQPLATAQVSLDTINSGFHFTHGHWYTLSINPSSGPSSTASLQFV